MSCHCIDFTATVMNIIGKLWNKITLNKMNAIHKMKEM